MPSRRSDPLALPDVNVLLALVHPGHLHHALAHDWLAQATRFATTPATESGLLRLAMNPVVMGRTVPPSAALASLRSLHDDPRATFVADDATFRAPQIGLVGLVGHRQVADVHLVNLAARHHAVLVTFDRALPTTLIREDRQHVEVIG
ncbi:MAG: TA system VapC family ribonuclease toxin [Dermatophilaceae bacterium]